jgi:hypothetical protein
MRVRSVPVVLGVLVGISLVACSQPSPSAPGLFFPTVPRQDAYPAALYTGKLVERSGCLMGGSEHELIFLWPDGYTARTGSDGRTQVLDEHGGAVATTGEPVSLGGGVVDASFSAAAYQHTPDACSHRYWLVAPS